MEVNGQNVISRKLMWFWGIEFQKLETDMRDEQRNILEHTAYCSDLRAVEEALASTTFTNQCRIVGRHR